MLSSALKIGTPAAIGICLGLLAIWWIEPVTKGGIGLIVLICILMVTIVQALFSWLKRKPEQEADGQ